MTAGPGPAPGWRVERHRGSAQELHALEWPDPIWPTVWLLEVDRPALVLGSTQRAATVDADALRVAGIDLVVRRSGGGAVLLVPGDSCWIDVVVPAGHARWDSDVNRSFHWLGEFWAEALRDLGLEAQVHPGPAVSTPMSGRVCFAGLGPGEVTVAQAKAVGLSQRRTRSGARLQALIHRCWDPRPLGVIAGVDVEALPPVVTLDRPVEVIQAAFLSRLA